MQMIARPPKLLFAFASAILALGGIAHATVFGKALTALANADIRPAMAGAFKALWLADSTTCITVAVTFAYIALRPSVIAGRLAMLLALVPGFTAILIYVFLGNFYAGHMLLAAAIAAFLAGLLDVIQADRLPGAADHRMSRDVSVGVLAAGGR